MKELLMKRCKKIMLTLLGAMIIITSSVSYFSPSFAQEKRTIKVGCVDISRFLVIDKDGDASGYGYEYLDEIKKHTGWNYEYVKGTWQQCLKWLDEGKIDLLLPAEYSGERAEKYAYSSNECWLDYSCLLTRRDNSKLCYEDFDNYNGITIGMIKESLLNDIFVEKTKTKEFTYKTKYYNTTTQLNKALKEGKVNAIVGGNLTIQSDQKILAQYNYVPAYFISKKSNVALINELDKALYDISAENPFFMVTLIEKYYGDYLKMATSFTREETDFGKKAKTLRVVTDPSDYPYQWYNKENSTFQGINIDFMKKIAESTGLNIQYIKSESLEESWELIKNGKADIILGVYGNGYVEDKRNVTFTDELVNSIGAGVVKKGRKVDLNNLKVAIVSSYYGTEKYVESFYPDWEFVYCKSEKECIEKVNSGAANITFINSLKLINDQSFYLENNLEIVPSVSMEIPLYIGVSKAQPEVLISLLNKAISYIDASEANQIKVANTTTSKNFSLRTFIKENPLESVIVVTIIFLLFFSLIVLNVKNKEKVKRTKLLEEANRKLEEASNAKSDFLRRMSHDMRTPMNGIMGVTQLTLDGELDEEVRENLVKIRDSSDYLLNLINDTLDMNKIESKKITLHLAPNDMGEIGESIKQEIKVLADKKGVNFIASGSLGHCKGVMTDKLRMKQIFTNLLTNAIKFTPEGGQVEFRMEHIRTSEGICSGKVSVKDNGIGMSEEFLPKLFVPFEQESNEITANCEGTGLGMPIVKSLVEMMDGKIEVHSKKNVGTEIIIYFNFHVSEDCHSSKKVSGNDKTPQRKTEEKDKLLGKRILICEDHPLNQEIARRILEKVGCLVEVCNNGQECVDIMKKVESKYFDLILMDIRMPVMDGLTAAREIRKLDNLDGRNIPIIAMTANAFDEDVEKSLEAGMNAHISKPIDIKTLFKTMSEAL